MKQEVKVQIGNEELTAEIEDGEITGFRPVNIVLALILFLALAWAAVVTFSLATNLWTGAAYSLAGGSVIGLGITYLLRRWWFKGIQRRKRNVP